MRSFRDFLWSQYRWHRLLAWYPKWILLCLPNCHSFLLHSLHDSRAPHSHKLACVGLYHEGQNDWRLKMLLHRMLLSLNTLYKDNTPNSLSLSKLKGIDRSYGWWYTRTTRCVKTVIININLFPSNQYFVYATISSTSQINRFLGRHLSYPRRWGCGDALIQASSPVGIGKAVGNLTVLFQTDWAINATHPPPIPRMDHWKHYHTPKMVLSSSTSPLFKKKWLMIPRIFWVGEHTWKRTPTHLTAFTEEVRAHNANVTTVVSISHIININEWRTETELIKVSIVYSVCVCADANGEYNLSFSLSLFGWTYLQQLPNDGTALMEQIHLRQATVRTVWGQLNDTSIPQVGRQNAVTNQFVKNGTYLFALSSDLVRLRSVSEMVELGWWKTISCVWELSKLNKLAKFDNKLCKTVFSPQGLRKTSL